jgi:hypothetical protein
MGSNSIAARELNGGDMFENSIRDAAAQNAINLRRVNSVDGEIVATNLTNLIGRVSGSSLAEIDRLVSELTGMRQHLEEEREHVQCAMMEFARLSQSTAASTNAMTEALEQMKRAANLRDRS